ncbi:amiloride-sensitive sodium channel subunit gamma [Latimeria chalumnae]|nr:PREDICTED: amiloride-sensitive sodium channel subunit gamma [Latimeria chalumnae]|eukprot:XP_006003111.1 PREDICTED: amiloride-sensitive sodium channel subunit gamma [Latimeria chalumnae]
MTSRKKSLPEKIKENLPVTGPQALSISELMRWYCYNTNTHGCLRIVASRGRLRRWIWILLTLSAVALIFWQCALLIISYYSVTVAVSVQFQELNFPAITICNINPYRYSATGELLQELERETKNALKVLYDFPLDDNESHVLRSTETSLNSESDKEVLFSRSLPLLKIEEMEQNYTIVSDVFSDVKQRVNAPLMRKMFENVAIENQGELVGFKLCDTNGSDCAIYTFNSGITAIQEWYRLHYINIMAQVSWEKKQEMGYSADDLIVTCFYNGMPCNSRNFTLFQHPVYGNCYTFNSGADGSILKTSTEASEFGLNVILYIDHKDYNPFLVTSTGAKVVIHDQNEHPFIEDMGLEVETATETSIGLQLTESHRLSSPYSNCTEDGSDVPMQNLYNTTYSFQMCLYSCFQKEMVQSCGCAHYEYPLPVDTEYCDYKKYPGWIYCYYKLRGKFAQEQLECQQVCKEACNSKEWALTKSLAHWPSLASEDWILRALNLQGSLKGNKGLSKNDLVNLGIFYKDLNLRSISESPANNIVTLLSNFGGQLGLWLSCSVVCVLEIIEVFFIDAFWIVLRQTTQKARDWWTKRKVRQAQPSLAAPTDYAGQHNPVYVSDEDPPTFSTAVHLPHSESCPVPKTPPPTYDALRIQTAFAEQISDTEDNEY